MSLLNFYIIFLVLNMIIFPFLVKFIYKTRKKSTKELETITLMFTGGMIALILLIPFDLYIDGYQKRLLEKNAIILNDTIPLDSTLFDYNNRENNNIESIPNNFKTIRNNSVGSSLYIVNSKKYHMLAKYLALDKNVIVKNDGNKYLSITIKKYNIPNKDQLNFYQKYLIKGYDDKCSVTINEIHI